MKLVVDANVLIAALIKNGTSREVIMSGGFTLVSPDFMALELGNHVDLVSKKSGLSTEEVAILLTLQPFEQKAPRLQAGDELRIFINN